MGEVVSANRLASHTAAHGKQVLRHAPVERGVVQTLLRRNQRGGHHHGAGGLGRTAYNCHGRPACSAAPRGCPLQLRSREGLETRCGGGHGSFEGLSVCARRPTWRARHNRNSPPCLRCSPPRRPCVRAPCSHHAPPPCFDTCCLSPHLSSLRHCAAGPSRHASAPCGLRREVPAE